MSKSTIKNRIFSLTICIYLPVLLGSCAADRQMTRQMGRIFKKSEVMKQYHVGFALYNEAAKKMVFEHNSDKYFTPASNTKLFTFYAGLKMIPDSVPGLRYIEKGDSIIFWGTGDPSFLQSQLKGHKVFDFLKSTNKQLFFAPGRYTGNFYGKGWEWDDYNDYYQAEINEFPIQGNVVDVSNRNGEISISPGIFKDCTFVDTLNNDTVFKVVRDFNENRFLYPKLSVPEKYTQQIPFKISVSTTLSLLSDTLKKNIGLVQLGMPADAKTVYSMKTDSVLKEMMLPSDNFIAEQLLLVYSNQLGRELNTEKAITYIKENYLKTLPDAVNWADGSGLSRRNLFTPRDIVALLELIYKEVNNPTRLYSLIPAGGKSGTLKNAYPKTANPFVFGKTGSLSNNHNQSGYVITKKKKMFIFSFMNNSFVLPTAEVRKEMVRVMTYIHDNF